MSHNDFLSQVGKQQCLRQPCECLIHVNVRWEARACGPIGSGLLGPPGMSAFVPLLWGQTDIALRPSRCARALSTATCSDLPANRGRAIFPPWPRNLARASTARRLSRRRKCASKPTGFPARHGISACSALGDRPNRRPPWATRSMRLVIRGAEINVSTLRCAPVRRRHLGGPCNRVCQIFAALPILNPLIVELALTTSRRRATRRLGWIGLPGAKHAQDRAGDHARTRLERFEPRTILKSYGLLLLNPNRRDSLRRLFC
ncbi:hypothetical protein ABID62_004138 [Bradyrhizobium sp. S3.9.1]